MCSGKRPCLGLIRRRKRSTLNADFSRARCDDGFLSQDATAFPRGGLAGQGGGDAGAADALRQRPLPAAAYSARHGTRVVRARVIFLLPFLFSTLCCYAGGITPHPTYRVVCS